MSKLFRLITVSKFVDSKMSLREWLPLLGITVSAFIFNTSEFMPVGLLTDIGGTFGTSEGETGLIVSVYAWAVMLLSLPLMIAASRIPFRPLVLLVLTVFCAGQALSAVAASYGMLMGARLVVACSHSIFWAIAAPVAVRVVEAQHGPLALSAVEAGTALANTLGLPIGRAVGLALGWRMTFACVGVVSFAVLVYLFIVFPKLAQEKPFTLKELPRIMRNKSLVGIFVLTALFAMGFYTGYSYIEPFLLQVGGLASGEVTIVLVAFGLSGIVGSALCPKLFPRHRKFFLAGCVGGVALSLLLMIVGAVSFWSAFAVCFLWGVCSAVYSVIYQSEIIRVADSGSQTVAMAIFSGIFNLGIGTGSFIGGGVCTYASVSLVGVAGGAIALAGFLYCLFVLIPRLQRKVSNSE